VLAGGQIFVIRLMHVPHQRQPQHGRAAPSCRSAKREGGR
jgi:hypothetical protein